MLPILISVNILATTYAIAPPGGAPLPMLAEAPWELAVWFTRWYWRLWKHTRYNNNAEIQLFNHAIFTKRDAHGTIVTRLKILLLLADFTPDTTKNFPTSHVISAQRQLPIYSPRLVGLENVRWWAHFISLLSAIGLIQPRTPAGSTMTNFWYCRSIADISWCVFSVAAIM